MRGKILKEIFIMVLLFIVVIFTIGILFYEFIPRNNEELSSIKYEASDRVLETLAEIQEKTGVDSSIVEGATGTLLKSYSITKSDLSDYKDKNYYESGKKDPFAEYSETVDEEVISTTEINKVDDEVQTPVVNQDVTNTVSNTVGNINSVSTSNTTSSTLVVKPNTNTNTTTNNTPVSNTTNNNDKSKEEDKSQKNQNTTGTYFEKKNSK